MATRTTERSLELAATAWCKPRTAHLTMIPVLGAAFADILDAENERPRKCPECGTCMVVSDEAGIEALDSLAEDKNAEIIQAGDNLYRATVDFTNSTCDGNQRKLDDAIDDYSALRLE